ncbi:dynein intermediate chain, cytosolic [Tremella mesenterica]|uniref:Dynein intermediate chain, cytosolic n=1 Tax=Tremella mesenterica TaxID=5217 RepID=A0A4Q1BTR7_TREME|nr:dynein intermediate chain, cytosolic [Tremella mesenterica]
MADRRQREIEEKRAKIQELRRAREERKAQAEKGSTEPLTSSRRDVNELVESLLAPSTRPTSPFVPAPSTRQVTPSQLSQQTGDTPPGLTGTITPGGRASRLSNDGSTQGGRRVPSGGTGISGIGGTDRRELMGSPFQIMVDYVDHQAELYELPSKPSKPVTYSKAIQTTGTSTSTSTSDLDSDDDDPSRRRPDGGSGRETEDEMRKRILLELEEERKALEKELEDLKSEDKVMPMELSSEQKQAIFHNPDFAVFIDESTRIVQRALSDNYDYIKDYTIGIDSAFDESEGQKVKLFCSFSDDRWTTGRSVTDLDWSHKFPELVAASYNKSPSALNDPDGIVAVWNLHLLERPEFIFHSPSDVLSVTFSPFHPTLIFGGSYSGQILLWDTRAKHLPVLKTPLSASGHTYPIYSMKMVGTQNANNLITSSTDGLVCTWLTDMLAQPQEALSLSIPSHNKTDEISITALDLPDGDTSTLWIGTEEGSIYPANRYDRASSKAGLISEDVHRGHSGAITGLHLHPSSGPVDLSDLFLTSSVDWTVKLWRTKASKVPNISSSSSTNKSGGGGVGPIHSFEESDDYVFDVKWHPHHPSVFGTVDGTGKFDLWNLNQDVEVPSISTQVSTTSLNKLSFDHTSSSRRVGIGGSDGILYIYELSDSLIIPKENEWVDMQRTVNGLSLVNES